MNRLELTPLDANADSRYKKIVADSNAMDALLVDLFLESYKTPPQEIVLDFYASDDPLHGKQEGRFFHGYYRHYCYLPLYIFCGEQLLCARLRTAAKDGAAVTVEELESIVTRILDRWPKVRIILRGDNGFCRDEIMSWCESHEVDYVLGLAKNNRLKTVITDGMEQARATYESTGKAARECRDFRYRPSRAGPVNGVWRRARRSI